MGFLLFENNYKHVNDNIYIKVKQLLKSYFFCLILIILTTIFVIFPLDWFIKNHLGFESIRDLLSKTNSRIDSYSLILTVLIIPLFEEALFRLSLKLNRLNILISFFCLTLLLTGFRFSTIKDIDDINFYSIIISLLATIGFSFFSKNAISFLLVRIKFYIWFSIIAFGLVHIYNIKIFHKELLLFYPFFVIPQMLLGYFITNLRLKYGFLWGFFLHAMTNFITFTFLLR